MDIILSPEGDTGPAFAKAGKNVIAHLIKSIMLDRAATFEQAYSTVTKFGQKIQCNDPESHKFNQRVVPAGSR